MYFIYFLKYPKKLKYTKDINNNFSKKCLEIFQNPLFIIIFKSQVLWCKYILKVFFYLKIY